MGSLFVRFRRRWVVKGMSLKDEVDDGEGFWVFGFSSSFQSIITGFSGLRSFSGKTVAYMAL